MSDHFTIKIPKPRITLYGLLVTAIVAWGAYSMLWKKPDLPKHAPISSTWKAGMRSKMRACRVSNSLTNSRCWVCCTASDDLDG